MRNLNFLKGTSTILVASLSLGLVVPLATLSLGCSTPSKDKASATYPEISGFYLSNKSNSYTTDTTTNITITKGDTVYVRATFGTSGGTAIVTPGNVALTSNVATSLGAVTESGTYTLTVTSGSGQKVTATATITAIDAPNSTMTAPASVVRDTANQSASVPAVSGSTYEWSIKNGTITGGAGTAAITFTSGSAGSLGAAGSMTLTCKVTSAASVVSTSTKDIPVVAIAPSGLAYTGSPFTSFINVPLTIAAPTFSGDPIQTFSVSPALPAGLTLNTATGAIAGTPTTVASSTTYKITGLNSGGSTSADVVLVVDAQPSIDFTANPSTIGPNGTSILSWAADASVSSLTIDQGVQTSTLDTTTVKSGSYNVSPTATTTYTLTANLAGGGSAQKTATVTLDATALALSNFAAEKATTTYGASDKLSWTLAGTPNSLLLNDTSVLGATSTTVIPVRRQLFTLSAVNGATNASATLTVPSMGLDLVAGSISGPGTADATTASAAQFNAPRQIAADGSGNIFVADAGSNTIRKVATTGEVTTIAGVPGLAGNVDGTIGNALLNAPRALAVSSDGSAVYVMDCGNKALRKIALSSGVWTTSTISTVTFGGSGYGQMTLDPTGAFLLAVDYNSNCVRVVRLSDSVAGVYAGPTVSAYGHADVSSASLAGILFDSPEAIAFNKAGTYFYVTDTYAGYNYVRAVQWVQPATSGAISQPTGTSYTIAGAGVKGFQDGTGASAYFNAPAALCVDSNDVIWMADTNSAVIRNITVPTLGANTGIVTTVAGTLPTGTVTAPVAVTGNTDGALLSAKFNNPQGLVAVGTSIYVSEVNNSTIRLISGSTVSTPIGSPTQPGNADLTGSAARFSAPMGLATMGGYLYVADNGNSTLRKVKISDGSVTTLATGFSAIRGVATDVNNLLYVADASLKAIYQIAADGTKTAILASGLTAPQNLAVSPVNPNLLYVVDGNAIYEVTVVRATDGTFTSASITKTIGAQATTGYVDSTTPTSVRFRTSGSGSIAGIVVDASGNIWVADNANYSIRKITAGTYAVTTYAGIPSTATYGFVDSTTLSSAKFNYLTGFVMDASGNFYIADKGNHAIRKIDSAGTAVTTVIGLASGGYAVRIGALPGTIGTGSSAGLYQPSGLAMDSNGDLFIVTNNGIMQATLIGSAQ